MLDGSFNNFDKFGAVGSQDLSKAKWKNLTEIDLSIKSPIKAIKDVNRIGGDGCLNFYIRLIGGSCIGSTCVDIVS